MIGEAGVKLFETMRLQQRQKAKEWTEQMEEIISYTIGEEALAIASAAPNYPGPERMEEIQQELVRKYDSEDQKNMLKASYIMDGSISMLRRCMLPVILRRTGLSKDPSGKTVLSLRPYQMVTAFSPLRPDEQAGFDHVNSMQLERRAHGER